MSEEEPKILFDQSKIPTVLKSGEGLLIDNDSIWSKNIPINPFAHDITQYIINSAAQNKKMIDNIPTFQQRMKPVIDRMDSMKIEMESQTSEIQELQKLLTKSNAINSYQKQQIKELNDKASETKYLLKIAETNLQDERDKSEKTHNSDRRLQIIIAIIGLTGTIGGTYLGYWLNLPK